MSILKNIIKEMAASGSTGAGSIAAAHGSLFGGGSVRPKRRKLVDAHRIRIDDMNKKVKNRNQWKWRIIGEMVENNQTFDPADVASKLDAAQKKTKQNEDTTPFGMEDEDGNIVKVYVRTEQADEFESALAALLAGEDEDDDDINTSVEIAEVLFKLKDKFDIVDVEWPNIEGDEEEEQELGGEDMGDADLGGEDDLGGEGEDMGDADLGGEDDLGGEGEDMGDADLGGEGDLEMEPAGGAESALQQVIDMMKADAEARKAESEARAKEAEARAAEANASAAAHKVKQEEDILDMEAFNKKVKQEEEEAQRLAKLAKFKHDQATRYETHMAQEEEESRLKNDWEPNRTRPVEPEDSVITKNELMTKILDYLKAN